MAEQFGAPSSQISKYKAAITEACPGRVWVSRASSLFLSSMQASSVKQGHDTEHHFCSEEASFDQSDCDVGSELLGAVTLLQAS